MRATRTYIERHGKPVAFYSDKHSAFRNNVASANGDGMSHLDRALDALNIELICANSPQAKGQVERANGTLQDRLVKAMRLEGIATIVEANAFLPFLSRPRSVGRWRASGWMSANIRTGGSSSVMVSMCWPMRCSTRSGR